MLKLDKLWIGYESNDIGQLEKPKKNLTACKLYVNLIIIRISM